MRVLITGGAGFIGQRLAGCLASQGHQPIIYDIQEPRQSCEHIVGTVFDERLLQQEVITSDVVVHLVALPDVGECSRNPRESFNLNVAALQRVLDSCRNCVNKKLVFVSSAAVYGIPETLPIPEIAPLKPTDTYGHHKHVAEQMIQHYHHAYGLSFVILRVFNCYGRGVRGLFQRFVQAARAGTTYRAFGTSQYRDFVYVGDVAEALCQAALSDKATNKIVNIGSGRGTQIRDVLDMMFREFPDANWIIEPAPSIHYDSIADISKARLLFDFEPHTGTEFMRQIFREELL